MASKILLLLTLVALSNAGFVWVDEDNDDHPVLRPVRMYVPPLPKPPPLPNIPGLPQPPPLPTPPPLYSYAFFPANAAPPPLPVFPPFINLPTPDEIVNIKPKPGQYFNGISVKSRSGFSRDEDGKLVKTGGTTVVINDNGEIEKTKVGNNPPDFDDTPNLFNNSHKFPKFEPITFKPFVFEPITFKPIVFEPITFKPIDINYKPGEGETYHAVSTSSHSESSNINGVVSQSGGTSIALNDNGKVDEEGMEYKSGDKSSEENK